MDVSSSIKSTIQPADVLSKLNRQKTSASSAWNATLNRATAARQADPLHGVTQARTLENAKLSQSTLNLAQGAFAKALNDETSKRSPLNDEQTSKLEATSQTLVNQFFMGSMLKQMRDNPFKDEMFSGGKGGQAYAGLFDQHLAENAGNRVARSLVKSMVKQYTKTSAGVGGGAA